VVKYVRSQKGKRSIKVVHKMAKEYKSSEDRFDRYAAEAKVDREKAKVDREKADRFDRYAAEAKVDREKAKVDWEKAKAERERLGRRIDELEFEVRTKPLLEEGFKILRVDFQKTCREDWLEEVTIDDPNLPHRRCKTLYPFEIIDRVLDNKATPELEAFVRRCSTRGECSLEELRNLFARQDEVVQNRNDRVHTEAEMAWIDYMLGRVNAVTEDIKRLINANIRHPVAILAIDAKKHQQCILRRERLSSSSSNSTTTRPTRFERGSNPRPRTKYDSGKRRKRRKRRVRYGSPNNRGGNKRGRR